ncbi:thiol reductant ABC exporter subunit CydD [Actinomycetaceae bacterium TAE3-ERU4]|nr:thiol reductant ABC exporter subunit CydD [Actinomycetaceae bacterium TAE3-ERU4]
MKPLDPRLLRYAKSARKYVILISVLGIITSALILAQTISLAQFFTPIIEGKITLANQLKSSWALVVLIVVLLARTGLIYLRESAGHAAAAKIVYELRAKVIEAATSRGPRWLAKEATSTTTLVTRGLANLVPYFVRYLPQLILSSTVTPMALLVMAYFDFWSAVIATLSIPLIPIFMILVGRLTQEFSDRKLKVMEKLGSQLLDLLSGLVTLKALGRASAPKQSVKQIGHDYNRSTMATLRLAFLSGAILEFISTLAVALVAVEVGLRLVAGNLHLYAGLIVIMLAPEVYNPLRSVGVQFHASADGVAAFNAAFKVIEEANNSSENICPDISNATFKISQVGILARGSLSPADVTDTILPGKITAICGPSGIGKSTLTTALLGLQKTDFGEIKISFPDSSSADVSTLNTDSLLSQVTWIPQSPVILPGTVFENIMLGKPEDLGLLDKKSEEVKLASQMSGFSEVINSLPDGWDTKIGHGGFGLSVGQRQRLALTRALLFPRPFLILDEPTAHLDAPNETVIIKALESLKARGITIIIIAHRPALSAIADKRIELSSRPLTAEEEKTLIEKGKNVDTTPKVVKPKDSIDTFFSSEAN